MITLIPIEPLGERHGALIVEAFGRLLIDGGGEPDGLGDGRGYGYFAGDGDGYGCGDGRLRGGDGWGDGRLRGGDGWGDGWGDPFPDEWRVE